MTVPGSLFPSDAFTVTKEEFDAFHSMDRALYSRLVLAIGRDEKESVQVMALWLWLERHCRNGRNFVHRVLSFSDQFVNMLAQESATCLRCIENNSSFPVNKWWDQNNTPMLHSVLGGQINLFYFMENRARILSGVREIIKETYLRAFDDILFVVRGLQSGALIAPREQPRLYGGDETRGEMRGKVIMRESVGLGNQEEMPEVEADQRTIFLTFSKGYPTSEIEVRDFFTRRYGDIIEAIHMQEVLPEEQALYARLVVRSARVFNVVLEGGSKAKFTINGKHVWARKFVKKHNQIN